MLACQSREETIIIKPTLAIDGLPAYITVDMLANTSYIIAILAYKEDS